MLLLYMHNQDTAYFYIFCWYVLKASVTIDYSILRKNMFYNCKYEPYHRHCFWSRWGPMKDLYIYIYTYVYICILLQGLKYKGSPSLINVHWRQWMYWRKKTSTLYKKCFINIVTMQKANSNQTHNWVSSFLSAKTIRAMMKENWIKI